MAIQRQEQQETNLSHQNSMFQLDALYCREEHWEEEGVGDEELSQSDKKNPSLFPLLQEEYLEDEELLSLFSKEVKQCQIHLGNFEEDTVSSFSTLRCEAVKWMLKVNAHYGFSTLTAVLAINYFDRFISNCLQVLKDRPYMIQLLAVTCLSLAAKVEETQVPLLLDLQVDDTKYVFEAKTIQKMELLVLSTLGWKMHLVTPLSFLHHIIRKIGITHLYWEFLKTCESLLLSVVPDSRFIRFLPSVLATATMLHVIDQIMPVNSIEYQNQLMGILKISKESVNECYQLINQMSKSCVCTCGQNNTHKRKHEQIPGSPTGVIDAYFSCDSSNDSWAVGSSSLSPSTQQPSLKKSRGREQKMPLRANNQVFVDVMSKP